VHRRPLDGGAAPAEPARVGALPLAGAARHGILPLTKRRPLESIGARGRTAAETERVRASEGGGERGERAPGWRRRGRGGSGRRRRRRGGGIRRRGKLPIAPPTATAAGPGRRGLALRLQAPCAATVQWWGVATCYLSAHNWAFNGS
jgi:hypothetical protein